MAEWIVEAETLEALENGFYVIGNKGEPVVRCRDCRHFDTKDCPIPAGGVVNVNGYCDRGGTEMRPIDADELKRLRYSIDEDTEVVEVADIDNAPTVEAEPYKEFCEWVASEVCTEDFEDLWSLGAFAEVACRKLYALGVVQKQGDEWHYEDGGENG